MRYCKDLALPFLLRALREDPTYTPLPRAIAEITGNSEALSNDIATRARCVSVAQLFLDAYYSSIVERIGLLQHAGM